MAIVLQKSLSHAAGSGMAHIDGKSSVQFSKSPADIASASGIERKTLVPIVRAGFGTLLISDRHGFKRATLEADPLSNLSETYHEYASDGAKTAFVNLL